MKTIITSEDITQAVGDLGQLAEKAVELHEDGSYDNAGRWYPSSEAAQEYCRNYRSPSRAHPYSRLKACCTIKANVHFGHITADEATLVRAYNRLLKLPDPLVRESKILEVAARLARLRRKAAVAL